MGDAETLFPETVRDRMVGNEAAADIASACLINFRREESVEFMMSALQLDLVKVENFKEVKTGYKTGAMIF
jgi:hypothetical protein